MGRLNRQRAPFVFGLMLSALLLAMLGCTRVDEVTPTPVATATGTAQPPTGTPAPPTDTPAPPTPTPTLTPTPECEIGMRLEPGEMCAYEDGIESDFILAVMEDGSTSLHGSVGTLENASRIARPGDKLCACGLETEAEGLSRTITALPEPIAPVEVREFTPPPSPFLGQCLVGMEVGLSELCYYTGTSCVFDVDANGVGRFSMFSDDREIHVSGLKHWRTVFEFSAIRSGDIWIIGEVPEPEERRDTSTHNTCPIDPQVQALLDAFREGDLTAIKNLLEAGVDVDARSESGTPMLGRAIPVAARTGNLGFINVFIDAGANVNAFGDHGYTVLRTALATGSEEILRVLLDAGADPIIGTENRSTIIHEVAWVGRLDTLQLFLDEYTEHGTVNQFDNPLLGSAIAQENIEMIEYLIALGADLHARYPDGTPILALSFLGDEDKTLKLLLELGADVNARDESGGPAWWLLFTQTADYSGRLQILLDGGADPNACDTDGNPMLLHALAPRHIESLSMLIRAGGDPNAIDAAGNPVLASAIYWEGLEIVSRLVEGRADVNARDSEGRTMLERAQELGNPEIVQYLIDAGAE